MGKAMFQLKSRLERTKVLQLQSSIPKEASEKLLLLDPTGGDGPYHEDEGAGLDDEEIIISHAGDIEAVLSTDAPDATMSGQSDVGCPSKSEGGNQAVCARFGRKRTHNEELCVSSCGMILARETFFGSESLTNIKVSFYFHYPIPSYIVFSIRTSGTKFFLRKLHCHKSFGWTSTAVPVQCLQHKEIPTSKIVHFRWMCSITNVNTRNPICGVYRTATQHYGQNL